jgi:hypothetical protein
MPRTMPITTSTVMKAPRAFARPVDAVLVEVPVESGAISILYFLYCMGKVWTRAPSR